MKLKLLTSCIALTNCILADGSLYILPQYSYGVSVLDSSIMPISNINIGVLYQFESSSFLLGGRIGYFDGTSNNYYIPQNVSNYNRTANAAYVTLSAGAGVNLNKTFRNNILLNIQYAPSGSYGINCSSDSQYCQTQLGKSFNAFGFGLENQLFYNLNSEVALGLTSGIMFNIAQLNNYSSVSGVNYNTTQTSNSTAPYIGLIMSYKIF